MRAVTSQGWAGTRTGSAPDMAITIHLHSPHQRLWEGRGAHGRFTVFLPPSHKYFLLRDGGNPASQRFQLSFKFKPSYDCTSTCPSFQAGVSVQERLSIILSCLYTCLN